MVGDQVATQSVRKCKVLNHSSNPQTKLFPQQTSGEQQSEGGL
jgi:hypothetical protein